MDSSYSQTVTALYRTTTGGHALCEQCKSADDMREVVRCQECSKYPGFYGGLFEPPQSSVATRSLYMLDQLSQFLVRSGSKEREVFGLDKPLTAAQRDFVLDTYPTRRLLNNVKLGYTSSDKWLRHLAIRDLMVETSPTTASCDYKTGECYDHIVEFGFCAYPPKSTTLSVLVAKMVRDQLVSLRVVLPDRKDNPFCMDVVPHLYQEQDLDFGGYDFVYRQLPSSGRHVRMVLMVVPRVYSQKLVTVEEVDDESLDDGTLVDVEVKQKAFVVYAPKVEAEMDGEEFIHLSEIIADFVSEGKDWTEFSSDILKGTAGSVVVIKVYEYLKYMQPDMVLVPLGCHLLEHTAVPIRHYVCDQPLGKAEVMQMLVSDLVVGAEVADLDHPYNDYKNAACYFKLFKDDVVFPIEGGEAPDILNDTTLGLFDRMPRESFREQVCVQLFVTEKGMVFHILDKFENNETFKGTWVIADGYDLYVLFSQTYRMRNSVRLEQSGPLFLKVVDEHSVLVSDRYTKHGGLKSTVEMYETLFVRGVYHDWPDDFTLTVIERINSFDRSYFRTPVCVINDGGGLKIRKQAHVHDKHCMLMHGFDAWKKIRRSIIRRLVTTAVPFDKFVQAVRAYDKIV